jgi:hypothetical protein
MNETLKKVESIEKELDRLYEEAQVERGAVARAAARWLKAVRAKVARARRALARAEGGYERAAAAARAQDARTCRAVQRAHTALRAACGGDTVALLPLMPGGVEPYVRALATERTPALRRLVARIRSAASPPWHGAVAVRAGAADAIEASLAPLDAALAKVRAAAERRAHARAAALNAVACLLHHLTDYQRTLDPRAPAAARAQAVWTTVHRDLPHVA